MGGRKEGQSQRYKIDPIGFDDKETETRHAGGL